MEIAEEIDGLRRVLETDHNEQRVLVAISEGLRKLRDMYRADRRAFSDEQIQFLQKARDLEVPLRRFIELTSELDYIDDRETYTSLLEALEALEQQLEGQAVVLRVRKEIRELRGKLPDLIRVEQDRWNAARTRRKRHIEEGAPTCKHGHLMEIKERQEDGASFWSCTEFPHCRTPTWDVSRAERDYLDGITSTRPPKRRT